MNGLLAQLFSTIDSKKRQLGGLLSDPLETLYQGVRNFGAEQRGLLDTQAQAYPWTGMTPQATPDMQARKSLADAGAAQGMAAATVWHGSPHKFDKFDSSKIGTGEGAQAYGHGLYLAESPGVAKSYQESLGGKEIKYGDKVVDKTYELIADSIVGGAQRNRPNVTLDEILSKVNKPMIGSSGKVIRGAPYTDEYGEKVKEAIRTFWGNQRQETLKGSLYKVDLPDEHIAKMLDWDKPLSQQVPEVRDAIKTAYGKEWDKVKDMNGGQFYTRSAADDPWGATGQRGKGQQEADAKWMRGLGIPGIRYLDGGSRGAGGGTSNFVVFPGNEGLLSILERNGQALK